LKNHFEKTDFFLILKMFAKTTAFRRLSHLFKSKAAKTENLIVNTQKSFQNKIIIDRDTVS